MIATLARLGLLLVACSAIGGSIWASPHPGYWYGLLLPTALFCGLAAILAVEFVCARILARSPQMAVPSLRTLLSAWAMELWATSRLVVWRVPFLSTCTPSMSKPARGRRGLVLVHGYGCNRGIWAAWLPLLEARQVPCAAINLEPVFASIADYAPLIESAVSRMQQLTGLAPVVVAHSMGGLAVRAWWAEDRSAQRLHRLITLATPHRGSVMAQLGHGPSARQMRPHSPWLASLQTQETPEHARRTLCFYSACDNIVIPSGAAILPGAESREVLGCAHIAIVDHPDCFNATLGCVLASD